MSRFVSEQTIARSSEDVWAYAADIVRHPEWMAVTDARVVEGDGTRTGARGRERMRFGPFQWDVEVEVAEAIPGRRIVWKAVSGAPFDLEVALDLDALSPASTRAMYAANVRLHGLWRLLSPLVAMEAKSGPARELQQLKAQVEAALVLAPVTT